MGKRGFKAGSCQTVAQQRLAFVAQMAALAAAARKAGDFVLAEVAEDARCILRVNWDAYQEGEAAHED